MEINYYIPMNATDVTSFFAPLTPGQPIQFQTFPPNGQGNLSYFYVGQDEAGPNLQGAFNSSPCATPESLALTNGIVTNVCEAAFTGDESTLLNPVMATPDE
jgi:hypothetical protein